ncbi:MAG: fumarylacetoacetate hydrolase family protein [Terracidiphilus sp.]
MWLHLTFPGRELASILPGFAMTRGLLKMIPTQQLGYDCELGLRPSAVLPAGPLVSDQVDPQAGLTARSAGQWRVSPPWPTLDFIFFIPALLIFITAAITLQPGELVLTGTPSWVGPVGSAQVRRPR